MTLLESLCGRYRVELTAGDVGRFLNDAARVGVQLQDVSWVTDLTIEFTVSRNEYKKIRLLVGRHGAEVRILAFRGFYWLLYGLLKRPVFLAGVIGMLAMGLLLPGRIFFLNVQGNKWVETSRILESASEFGVRFGASRRLVRSEQVKNQLIGAIPELGWVGVNTKGCVAVISVREKTVQEPAYGESEPCDILAARDGIILNCSSTKGRLLCCPGQAVSAGDILISGRSSVGDLDIVTGASGEVFAATERHFSLLTPDLALMRGENHQRKVNFSLQIGKNLINFFKGSGIYGGSCVKMYSKYVLTLPGGFCLPVALIKWTVETCDMESESIPRDEAKLLLSGSASTYLDGQMIAGRIVLKQEYLTQSDGIYQMTGDYACTEMIGRAQKEQIGANHGKTD